MTRHRKGLVLLLFLFLSCSSKHYVEGLLARDKGDYDQAYQEFARVSPSHPIYGRAQREMREIREKARAIGKARTTTEGALSRNDRVAARISLKKLLSLRPGDQWATEQLANLEKTSVPKERKLREIMSLVGQKRFYEAKSSLEAYIKRNAGQPQAVSLLKKVSGEIDAREAQVESLLQQAEEAQGNGNVVGAYVYYGQANSLLPEDDQARTAREGLEPQLGPALDANVARAQELISQGKGDEAVDLLTLNVEAAKAHEASRKLLIQELSALALDSYRTSNYDRAVDFWKKLLRYDPKNTKARDFMKKAQKLAKRVKEL